MADKTYRIIAAIPGYYTSLDAKNKRNKRTTVQPATYYIFKEANSMINVTSHKGTPGSWINPEDNKKSEAIITEKKTNEKTISTKIDNKKAVTNTAQKTITSNSNNKKVYRITKDYIPCYIINTITGGKIEFDVEPDEITDSNSAHFDPQEIRGRSSPFQGYNGSGPRTINFELILHDDLCKEGILNTVNRLRSLTYPGYGGVLTAPSCIIRIGKMIHMKATVDDVNVIWQKPYREQIYLTATVSLTLSEVVDTPYSASDIWSKGGFI